MAHDFKNEVFHGFQPTPARICSHCGEKAPPFLTMLDPRHGHTVRVLKCRCGEQIWLDEPDIAARTMSELAKRGRARPD